MSNNQEKLNEQLYNVVANSKDSDEARLKKVKYLVRLGADVNTRLYGKSVLSKAIEQKAGAQVQDFLREKGAIKWVISKKEAKKLSQGFWDDKRNLKSLEEIKELLKKGADLEAKDKFGQTALVKAASLGKLDVVKYLVEHGADLEAKYGDGRTSLMKAARWGELDAVKCLVELGADVNASNKYGDTALMMAIYNGHLEVVKYLAECGVDVNASSKYGKTALDIARECREADCVEFLEEAQKKVSAQKNKGDKTSVSPIVKANGGRD